MTHLRSDAGLEKTGKGQTDTDRMAITIPAGPTEIATIETAIREVPDAFSRHVHLPRGRDREPVHDRDREYTLRGSESRTLATVARSEWSPVVISETTTGARLTHGPATCGTCANKD